MTTIAWDGKSIAADKRAVMNGTPLTVTKLFRFADEVISFTGDHDLCLALMDWYKDGADPLKYPAFQSDKDKWVKLIVANAKGARYFCQAWVPIVVEDSFMAWGSGMDAALAAMHCGKTAREAVQVACIYDTGSGNGIDVELLLPKSAVIDMSQSSPFDRHSEVPVRFRY